MVGNKTRFVRCKIAETPRDPSLESCIVFDALIDSDGKLCGQFETFGYEVISNLKSGVHRRDLVRLQPDLSMLSYEWVETGGRRVQMERSSQIAGEFRARTGSKFRLWIDDEYIFEVVEVIDLPPGFSGNPSSEAITIA